MSVLTYTKAQNDAIAVVYKSVTQAQQKQTNTICLNRPEAGDCHQWRH